MSRFTGQKCQSCKEALPDENVVVCPECGAPYHSTCFEREKKCVYEESHGQENCFSPEVEDSASSQICRNCGKKNSQTEETCSFCGKSVKEGGMLKKSLSHTKESGNADESNDTEKLMDSFIMTNITYYRNAFRHNLKFNFAALFSPVSYFFYRKMYLVGSLIAGGFMGILYMFAKQMEKMVYLNPDVHSAASMEDVMRRLLLLKQTNPYLYNELAKLSTSILFITFSVAALCILIGFFANNIYKRHVLNNVKQCKAITDESKERLILLLGGTNLVAGILTKIGFWSCVLKFISIATNILANSI
ncbi:MAG: hypothetical protein LBJ38_00735 [Oscillospiraceae bacterium]|nr:hypothetical protein [Oscillospiraceae bacterium]